MNPPVPPEERTQSCGFRQPRTNDRSARPRRHPLRTADVEGTGGRQVAQFAIEHTLRAARPAGTAESSCYIPGPRPAPGAGPAKMRRDHVTYRFDGFALDTATPPAFGRLGASFASVRSPGVSRGNRWKRVARNSSRFSGHQPTCSTRTSQASSPRSGGAGTPTIPFATMHRFGYWFVGGVNDGDPQNHQQSKYPCAIGSSGRPGRLRYRPARTSSAARPARRSGSMRQAFPAPPRPVLVELATATVEDLGSKNGT